MMPPASPSPTAAPGSCPSCAAPASGRFCANCGASLEGATCASCRAELSPGARYCHRCGTAASAAPTVPPDRGIAGVLPWAVAGIALAALIALVAGQRFGGRTQPATAAAAPSLSGAPLGPAMAGAAPGGVMPNLATMTPREQADRLYDRIMRLDSEGKRDSVQFFAQMAMVVYQQLPDRDADVHYDMGRVAEVSGAPVTAAAEADTILQLDSAHLLGLMLGISSARDLGDTASVRRYEQRLLAVAPAEKARALPEYERHRVEIDSTLARLTRGGGA